VKMVKKIWLLACFSMLALFLLDDNAWQNSELSALCYIRTLVLTFPSGFLGGVSVGYIFSFVDIYNEKAEFFITWLSMVVIGYLQWFVFFPAVYKLIRQWRSKTMHG
jgi:thiamine transporter ThiT